MDMIVTGATSFLGRAMIKRLLRDGHQVWAVVRPGSKNRASFEEDVAGGPDLHIVELEMERFDCLPEKIGRKCDVFFHFCWDGAGSENRKRADIQQKNAVDSRKALQAAKDLGCRRFLFSGSQAEYGVCHSLMTEETACSPVSEYGKAKVNFGSWATAQAQEWQRSGISDMEYVHTRIFSVYGPGDHEGSLVNTCLRTFLADGEMKMGACTQMWNFLYIDDLAEGMLALALCGKKAGGYYNLAAGRDATMPLREYVEEMRRLCGGKGSTVYGELPPNAEGQAQLIPDITKITETTGWKPCVSFAEGIGRMLALMEGQPR